ncbi:MAG: DUF6273 domain-containing protein, partial [Eubacteriales bacterium]
GRKTCGSNLWETSNMRSWLNSTAATGNVTWLDGCPPAFNTVHNYLNAYAAEKGFLADGNFTADELNAIKSVTQKSILYSLDVTKLNVDGTAIHVNNNSISTVVQNFATAYYQNVTDKMFLLDVKQINKVYQNSSILGTNYYIGKPTQKAVNNSEYIDSSLLVSNNWPSMLRTPYLDTTNPSYVRHVATNGSVLSEVAYVSRLGVRPAFYIDLSAIIFKSGNGTVGTPYSSNDPTVTAAPTDLVSTEITDTTVTLSWTPVAGATGYTVYKGTTKLTETQITATTYTAADLTPNTEYSFTVKAVNPVGESLASNALVVKTNPLGSIPIKIGDYLQMGRYNNEAILWRCVDIDENGPLMLADRILTIKPFDAAGNHTYLDGTPQKVDGNNYRTTKGSNLWETSNMRSWLNSTASAGNVTWLDGCPPTADKVATGKNAYANEKGFLAEGNFSANERSFIKSVSQKSILNGIDVSSLSVGGTANHIKNDTVSTIVQNYDTAYYHNVTDKMFLLDVKQLNKVYLNGTILGAQYYIGKPTQKAVDQSEYKDSGSINAALNGNTWIRTPWTDPYWASQSRYLYPSSTYYSDANNRCFGARPAFYLDLLTATYDMGDGSLNTPYSNYQKNTVTYDPNGSTSGIVPVDNTAYAETAMVTVANGNIGNLKKTGYAFIGWNTKADGSGTNYAESGTFAMGSTNVVLYANWLLTPVKIGEYIQMGKYYDEPILWRCVDININGPLMLADKIITVKPFDASGFHLFMDGRVQGDNASKRATYGSNLWETSNLRSWLNSTATAGNVLWPDACPPTEAKVYNGENDYANEKGFLAEGNFTVNEISLLKSVTQKSLLNYLDSSKLSIDGTLEHEFSPYISGIIRNYNTAYYHNVQDKMFLLDVKQINNIYQKSDILGENYYIGKPTQSAVENSERKSSDLDSAFYCDNWLRSPVGVFYNPDTIRSIKTNGEVSGDSGIAALGTRPAFYLDLSTYNFNFGNGTEGLPYSEVTLPCYSVTYDANGAASGVLPSSTNYLEGKTVTVANNSGNLFKKNYAFLGWNTKADGSGTNYAAGEGTFAMGNTNVILYARWLYSTLKIGDYFQLGKYYDEPILWRCVDIDENGPLMLADRILTLKAFDAKGNHSYFAGTPQEDFGGSREGGGSNLWETSNIRSWLNSTAVAKNVQWPDGCPPAADNLYGGYNAYADEKGFLAEGNFTLGEKAVVKSVTQKNILNEVDVDILKIGGTEVYNTTTLFGRIAHYYNHAFYQNITDNMFLLDLKQMVKVYENSDTLGENYYIGKLTQKAVDNSALNETLSTTEYYPSWLRSPNSEAAYPSSVPTATGMLDGYIAYSGGIGVRPAFYIDLSSETEKLGNGSVESPYILDIDTTPPESATFTADKTTPTNTDVNVTITYPSDVTVKQYKVGNGAWTDYLEAVTVSTNTTVYARGQDAAGNWSSESSVVIANIDKVAPIVTGVTQGATQRIATINFNEGTATLNGVEFTSGSSVSSQGNYILIVTDTAQNATTISFSINTTVVKGDVNGDGKISVTDAIKALQDSSGVIVLTEIEREAADVNNDNNISVTDALKILQYVSGIITSF